MRWPAEITSGNVVPLGYLLTLMLLFLLLVLDRLAYTLGSPLGKALLHLRWVRASVGVLAKLLHIG